MSKIIFVDDDVFITRMYERVFRRANHELVIAHDGAEAYEILKTMSPLPDAIIMDEVMPKMMGAELLDRIRKSGDKIKDIPVIVLTNSIREESAKQFTELGATLYLTKMEQNTNTVVQKTEEIIKARTT